MRERVGSPPPRHARSGDLHALESNVEHADAGLETRVEARGAIRGPFEIDRKAESP